MSLEIWVNMEQEVQKLKNLHNKCKDFKKMSSRLQENSGKYKQRVDMKRREKEFQVGDLVMVYLRK